MKISESGLKVFAKGLQPHYGRDRTPRSSDRLRVLVAPACWHGAGCQPTHDYYDQKNRGTNILCNHFVGSQRVCANVFHLFYALRRTHAQSTHPDYKSSADTDTFIIISPPLPPLSVLCLSDDDNSMMSQRLLGAVHLGSIPVRAIMLTPIRCKRYVEMT